jgi:hypothetical protein
MHVHCCVYALLLPVNDHDKNEISEYINFLLTKCKVKEERGECCKVYQP